ncbi:aminopeptidase P family protein [Acetobacteraceae bacterium KSS8]|uniref:Aminopeptidase P family protein n=1 Tax=Endosaccharibacter trunci TaxID=2812733 RepID=A0ABT1W5Q3_9PROT|nr:aminopeptidase P family protein [Acetobacteraceae bacterium KSS8]
MTITLLDALRRSLPAHGIDGYLVPRGDEHLGEDVPACAERLKVLSGFTGSAGLAIVLPDTSLLFTDGRYMLQAPAEAGPAWQCLHNGENPPSDWLNTRGGAPLRLGYDPMVIGRAALDALEGSWGTLVPVRPNLVDAVWTHRPAPPATPIQVQDAALAGRTVTEKLALVAETLRTANEDAAVLSDPAAVCWLLNLRARDLPHTPALLAHALVRADATAILFVAEERMDARVRAHLGDAVRVVQPDTMPAEIDALAGLRVRIDPARTPVWFEQALLAAGAELSQAPDPCLMPRACKTEAELEAFRQAHRQDGVALTRFLCWVERNGIGQTEMAVSNTLLGFRMATNACSGASFASIAATGANAALMHYHPAAEGSAPLAENALFLIDSGGQYAGATTDVTRTVWLGDATPPEAWRDQFTRVLQGLIALTEAVFPEGTSGHRLDMLAREPLWRAGLDFDHGAGHGLGSFFGVHEWPSAFSSKGPNGPVHRSMVLTNEPGYYKPGSHGIRLENAMAVEARAVGGEQPICGFETLTLAPIDRRMIDTALLDESERRWVDRYHARVLNEIGPHLDTAEASWLERACAPLGQN